MKDYWDNSKVNNKNFFKKNANRVQEEDQDQSNISGSYKGSNFNKKIINLKSSTAYQHQDFPVTSVLNPVRRQPPLDRKPPPSQPSLSSCDPTLPQRTGSPELVSSNTHLELVTTNESEVFEVSEQERPPKPIVDLISEPEIEGKAEAKQESEYEFESAIEQVPNRSKPTDLVMMERAYQIFAKRSFGDFDSFCKENGIDEADQERIASRYDRIHGIAMPLTRENYPIKKKWENSGKSAHFWGEPSTSSDSLDSDFDKDNST